MSKRLLKLHKRKVARAKTRVKLSEPDVRTSEQLKAARDAGRPDGGQRSGPNASYSTTSIRTHARPASSAAKADG